MCHLSRIHANGADIPWGRGDRQLVAGRLPLLPPDEPLSPVGGGEREFAAENARKLQRVVHFSEALRAAAGGIGAGQADEVSNDLCDTLFQPNFQQNRASWWHLCCRPTPPPVSRKTAGPMFSAILFFK